MSRAFVPLLVVLALMPAAHALASSPSVRTDHLQSRLVAETTAAVPGTTLTLGLLLEHDPHWHTYWRNPGDSGLPTKLEFELPEGVVAAPIAWPHPRRFELAQIANYGYEERRLLPVTITLPAGYAAATLPVRAKAAWLVCEEVCIPGKAQYAFELPVATTATADARWSADFAAARADAPQDGSATLAISEDGDDIVLSLPDPAATPARWQWFPESPGLVANTAGPLWQRAPTGWQARWTKDAYFTALPTGAAFVASDESAASDVAAPRAWRFAGIGAAIAPTPSTTAMPVEDPPKPFPTWLMTFVAVLIAATIAVVLRATRPRRASPARPEETPR